MGFVFFWFRFRCAWLWLVEKFRQTRDDFFLSKSRLILLAKCTITTKQHNCWFLVLKRSTQHVRAGFALFTVVKTGNFFDWKVNTIFVRACWTIHISNNILNWFFRLFKNIKPNSKRSEFACSSKGILHTCTWTSIEDIDSRFPQEIRKSYCARNVYPNTLFSDNTCFQ